jgi:hypothetical protein
MYKKQDQKGGFLPMLIGALAPALIQGLAGAFSGKGLKKKTIKGGKKGKRGGKK